MKSARRQITFPSLFIGVMAIMTFAAFLMLSSNPTKDFSGDKSQIAENRIKGLEIALQSFRFDVGRYPTSEEGLIALTHNPGNLKSWRGPYLQQAEVPKDSWGR